MRASPWRASSSRALELAAPPFTGVVVAEILSAERHPQAERLTVCRVSRGSGPPLQIVCGATNARAGLKSALAVVGAKLPGDLAIKAAQLRGVESQGMLASAKELGIAESSSGILELPTDAPLGAPLRDYLGLDEAVLDVNVTPNRGDAMSILGIAREVSALRGRALGVRAIRVIPDAHGERFPVQLAARRRLPELCRRASSAASTIAPQLPYGCASGCGAPACAPSARWSTSPTT